jgi:hypothetical protein
VYRKGGISDLKEDGAECGGTEKYKEEIISVFHNPKRWL